MWGIVKKHLDVAEAGVGTGVPYKVCTGVPYKLCTEVSYKVCRHCQCT